MFHVSAPQERRGQRMVRGPVTLVVAATSVVVLLVSLLPTADNTLFVGRYCE